MPGSQRLIFRYVLRYNHPMTDTSITQIRVGRHRVGIIGLNAALNRVADAHQNSSDTVIADNLLHLLSKKNYISQTAREDYRQAFLRAYKKQLGLAVDNSPSDFLEIKILGGGCNICDGLENTVMEVLSELNLPADVEHIREKDRIRQFNVQDGPALVINQEVVARGTLPLKPEIETLFMKFCSRPAEEKKEANPVLIKNIPVSESLCLAGLIDYREGRIVSRAIVQKAAVSITLFALDKDEEISTHTAPGDAMVQVLEGQAQVTIGDKKMDVGQDRVVVMPANIPHSVRASQRFKMLLTVVKP